MKEIGGYFELDNFNLPMLHSNALALNCGRNCLAYLIEARKIKKIYLPYFLCDSIKNLCKKYKLEIYYYHINHDFLPEKLHLERDEWLYLVNYYGQITNDILQSIIKIYKRVIIDNAQAYFEKPLPYIDTIYTCRKFFGVADGAFLYTTANISRNIQQAESFERMHFILGRYEKNASDFFSESIDNNNFFNNEPLKTMSKLTENLLHGIDYETIKSRRSDNFLYLDRELSNINKLKVKTTAGPFMYPLLTDNVLIRQKLIEAKVYTPTLWPNVLDDVNPDTLEYYLANNIIPLPCDQRYNEQDMKTIISILKKNNIV